jgi:hypothetical protein
MEKERRKINSKPYTLTVFDKISSNEEFPKLYDNWAKLTVADKERVLLQFTILATPPAWISSYAVKGKEIRYIKSHVAKRILNLLFGVGNWSIDVTLLKDADNDANYVSYGYGYLVIKWFDGTERRIPTAGSGTLARRNGMVNKGDDLKATISDMIKKGLANMGFFADIYGTVEAVEDTKGTDKGEENKPHYDYKMLAERVEMLIKDYLDGVDIANRYSKAVSILTKAGYNDLLIKLKDAFNEN